jgi:hypothetical protein
MRNFGSQGVSLWDDTDGFFYDVLVHDMGEAQEAEPLRVRSVVGLLPILAVALAPPGAAAALPDFAARLRWLQQRRPDLLDGLTAADPDAPALLALVDAPRLSRLLSRMFDEKEFLAPNGIRSLSAAYRVPFSTDVEGTTMTIDYEPGESRSNLFGGNSNWRGPVWFPVNVLLADALRTHGAFHGDAVRVEFPTGSGKSMTLAEVADALDSRLVDLFRAGDDGRRPCDGDRIESSAEPVWRDHITFSEYFHGDTGEGLGASHQTGWTALVAHILCRPDR